jgi:hypothetical protein
VAEVYDFVTFLQERYGQRIAVDVSDAWSEEDLHDLMEASLAHARHADMLEGRRARCLH